MYCVFRLIKGLDDRRTNPIPDDVLTKIPVSSQIAQKRNLRAVWASQSFSDVLIIVKREKRSMREELGEWIAINCHTNWPMDFIDYPPISPR